MRDVMSQLKRLRGKGWAMLLAQRLATVTAWVLGVLFGLGLLDFLFRFPAVFRAVLLVAGLLACGLFVARYLVPVFGFRPSLTEMALRVERTIPNLEGRLASSVEFAASGISKENALAARSVRDTESRVRSENLSSVIAPKRTRHDLGAFLLVALIAGLVTVLAPGSVATAAQRVLLPFGSAQWPARTAVESMMGEITVHPRGQSLALRARGVKAPHDAIDTMDIRAHYRMQTAGLWQPWHEVVLTHQVDALYERLVETEADAIEFQFASDDSETLRQTIHLVPPPAVDRASLTVTPPAYAKNHVPELTLELGPGLDERAITKTPSLLGSRIRLMFDLNKPIPVPSDTTERARWLASAIGWLSDGGIPDLAVDGEETDTLVLSWTLSETTSLSFDLVDEYGLHNADDIAYRIDAVEDRIPSVTITQPESDRAVLPSALIPLVSEARDDVAISGLGLVANKIVATTQGEAKNERLWRQWSDADEPTFEFSHDFDLSRISLVEGDVIEITGIGRDNFYLDGEEHAEVRSAPRRLRIISERDFGEALFHELKALRQNAIRLETQEAELQDDVIDEGVQPGIRHAQDQIGEGIADQLQSLERLLERKETNRFDDAQLDALIDQAEDLLSHAGQASNRASKQIEQQEREAKQNPASGNEQPDANTDQQTSSDPGSGEPADQNSGSEQPRDDSDTHQNSATDTQDAAPNQESSEEGEQPLDQLDIREPAEEDREIVEEQQEVRDELTDLIKTLDRNEDSWVMNRQIQDLLKEQANLQQETGQLGEQTRGRPLDELQPTELSELDRIAQRQKELAQKMRDLSDELRDRSDDLESVDPQAAAAQRQAADTAEQREIDREMDRAGESAQQNQLQNAQNSQQKAREGLERMLDDLDQKSAQTEELHRRLQSLIESIERLVTVQENEVNALGRARQFNDFSGRDRAMIRLHQNTQAVSQEARTAGRETARIARSLDRSGDAQSAAIGYLRENPVGAEDANSAERRSLELLKEALELANELEQEVEEDIIQQRREELLTKYRELAEREIVLRGETLELQQRETLGRRELVEARKQSNVQEDIRTSLDNIRKDTQEISESLVFNHVHSMLDDWTNAVTESLRSGDVSVNITDQQLSIAQSIGQLIKALEEEKKEQEEFSKESSSGGGGGGGQSQPAPLIPPLTELKLLRGVQQHIYDRTTNLDTREDIDDAARRQRLRALSHEQDELHNLGQEMLEALQSSKSPGGPGAERPDQGGAQ